ncbi:hypothetical protein ACFSQQ_16425 [Mesorhizobium kowhaii]|uniref:hypothetical protein n=1 Tax=Mesorhizobium kowhaii TaxID=1300272 RepID=UPI0035EA7971
MRLVLRLICESEGNAAELQGDVITPVSSVVLSGLVEIRADLFDAIDLGQIRTWAQFVKPGCSTQQAMASALLLIFAGPDIVLPAPAEPDRAEERRREINAQGAGERHATADQGGRRLSFSKPSLPPEIAPPFATCSRL